ncbi:MAG TPA: hypothetical protein VJ436_02050, partial [Anaerolineales bacterium]|nr:hypothetical protein [Anaerolineales bacterium]
RHAHLLGPLDDLLDIAEAVEQGVFGMNVKVNEGHGSGVIERTVDLDPSEPVIFRKNLQSRFGFEGLQA